MVLSLGSDGQHDSESARAVPGRSRSIILSNTMMQRLNFCLWALTLVIASDAEVVDIDLAIPPTSASLRYMDGYLQTPGWIDLSDLIFSIIQQSSNDDYWRWLGSPSSLHQVHETTRLDIVARVARVVFVSWMRLYHNRSGSFK